MPKVLDQALAAFADTPETIADTQSSPSYTMPKPAAPSTLDASVNDYASQGEADQLRGSVALGTKTEPSKALKVLQLTGKTGLPRDFIERNLDFVDQETAKQALNPTTLLRESPAFAAWLAESPDHVAVAKPDVHALSFIEKQLRNIPAQYEQGQRTVEYGNVMLGIVEHLLDKKKSSRASQMADLIGGYIDQPRGSAPGLGNPTHPDDPQYAEYAREMSRILGVPLSKDSPYDARQFGETYNPEEYRGIRFLLPGSHGKDAKDSFGEPIPGAEGLLQEFIGEMISRGYPVLGGIGQLYGRAPGFNPVGFGQRDTIPDKTANLTALRKRQAELEAEMSKPDETGLSEMTGLAGIVQRAPGWMAQQLPILASTLAEQVKTGAKGVAVGALAGGAAGGLPGATVGGVVTGGAAWRLGAAINSAKMEFAQAFGDYEKLKDAEGLPLDQATAMGLAGMVGVVNGAIDGFFGVEGLTSKLPGVNQFTRQGIKELLRTPTTSRALLAYAKMVGQTMAVEGVTEAIQMYITKTGGVILQAVKDGGSPADWLGKVFSPENLQQAATEAEAGAFGGGGIATVMATPQVAHDISRVRAANQAKQAFEAIGKATAETKFHVELPDQLRKIVENATKDGPIETLYVPEHAFTEYFQKEGVDPREVYKEITGDVEAYDQAVTTGADLPIKTADYAQKLAGTKHNAFFAHEMRTSVDAMNGFEADEWVKEQDKQAEAEAAQAGVQASKVGDPLAQVQQDIAGQLLAAGFDPTVVDQYAALFEARYRTRAERRGLGESPAELFKQLNLSIIRPLPEVLRTLGGHTTELDALLNRLRTGDVPTPQEAYGQSLTEFLKEKGGLVDVGGELKARNVDAVVKPFTKKLIKKGGKTLDQAALQAFEAGYIAAPSINDLLSAIEQETQQRPVYASGKENARAIDVQMNLEALKAYLDQKGVNLATATNAEVKAMFGEAVQQMLPSEEGQTFAQAEKGPKGSITFGSQQISIKLLEKADLSTFIHESGHLYLNELIDDATTVGVSPQLTADLDTVLKWMGLDVQTSLGAAAIKAAVQTKHHEQFARGFEAYTMEGKSPSQAMREVFATFRRWLIQTYRSLTTAPLNVRLTKDVREVMDRMIATDEEIDRAATEADVHPLFTDAESAGMTPTEFAAYRETVTKASLLARETLQKKLMAQYQRQHEQWWKDRRAELVQSISDQVNDQPEYVALAVLQTGKLPTGADLPEGVAPMKLDRKAIRQQFGQDFLKTMPTGTTINGGMHPDTAAPLFGFASGQEMVLALVNARPKQPLIEAEADRQMVAEFGDLRTDGTIADAARTAVLNEQQEQVIAAEIRALNAKRREVQPFVKAAATEAAAAEKVGRETLRTMIPTLEDMRELARKILGRVTLKNLNPYVYTVAARQASKQATTELAKKNYVDAGHFKQRELLNLALFREAMIVREQIDSAQELFKNLFKADATLAKSRNVDLVNVGRAILAQYGVSRPTEKTAAEYLDPIKHYDQDLYAQWKPQVDALAPRALDYRAMTVQEFTKLHEDVQALWLLSRRTQQIKVNEQLIDRDQVIDELSAVMAGFTKQQTEQVVGAQTPWADTTMGLLSWGSALKRVESWVRRMDGGNIDGLFRRYVWTPISEASDRFREAKKTMLQQYLELIKPIEQTLTRDLIPAPELEPNVSFRGKTALLHAVLHTGNESNLSKLLRGYHWEPAAWQRFLDRMYREKVLTKLDYDFAQGVWDLLDSIKPQAQQAHHDMYGYYFSEITARALTTPWGDYRGGYVPAIADRVKSVDQAIREEKDLFDQAGNSFMFPTTGRGFTKARIEEYAAPLALDMTAIPTHLDKTMRFIHLEPRVKDAARLVTNKRFRAALDAMNSTVAKDMLVPWLQRSAQQTVSTSGKNRHADALWRYLRKSVGAQIMVGNVINTLQQFTGFPIAATQVKARYLRGAMMNYLRHPIQTSEDIAAKSTFMRGRTATQVIEIQQTIDDILLNPTKYDQVRKFLERHGYFLQQGTQNIVDLVTWGGAYDQAIAQELDERMAVRAADSAVRLTQGTFAPEDLSAFEAGTPFTRAFTMFYSYFNMQANLLHTEMQIVAHEMGLRRGAGRALYVYLLGFMIPAVLSESIIRGLGGFNPDDDDDYLNEALSVFFGSQLRTALAMVPGVGPIILSGIGAFTKQQYDDRISTSPIVTVLESAVRAPHSIYKAMSEDGHSKRAVRDLLTLLGLVTGLPLGALSRPLGYTADVYDGVAQPESAGDVARGLLSGKDVNRTK